MGQLKPSEVRLLIIFFLTVLILGSFFLYEWYAKALGEVKAEHVNFQAERQSLLSMRQQQNEYNQKRVWLDQNQPIARDEFEAKEALDRVVSVRGIEAAGLTLVSAPPEKDPNLQPYYWAFERRVIVQGDIQNIVQWLASLQSESSFRAVTQLHIFPKKKKEPETLTCEVTIEQRYATEEIVNMTGAVFVAPPQPPAEAPPAETNPTTEGEETSTPSAAPVTANNTGDSNPASPATTGGPGAARRVVVPSAAPPAASGAGGASNGAPAAPEVTRPRVRLPGPPADAPVPAPAGDSDDEQASINVGTGSGLLANSMRQRLSRPPVPPPPMAGDIAQAAQTAAEYGQDPAPVRTGIEAVPDAVPETAYTPREIPTAIRIDEQPSNLDAPGPRQNVRAVLPDGIVGEDWNQDTPGAGGESAAIETEVVTDSPTN